MQTATVDKKGKVKTTKNGRVIGQQFVKGRQLKGQSQVEFQEAAAAAEIDATNALDKDRVPRIYRKAVRNYFDRLGERVKAAATGGDTKESGQEKPSEKEKPGKEEGSAESQQ
ncbi:MAG TPA: hypothetical protein VMV94_18880 [Phycisphaerae bacterium]|nr:hypothetical protein [Phycisphaerae bacterium]